LISRKYGFAQHTDVIWQTTPDMVFTYVSPSIKEQRGYDANEVLGRQIWDFIAPNEILSWRNRVKQPFNLLLSREVAFETEPYELHVRKDGTPYGPKQRRPLLSTMREISLHSKASHGTSPSGNSLRRHYELL
jgi:PAS domain-containing protein